MTTTVNTSRVRARVDALDRLALTWAVRLDRIAPGVRNLLDIQALGLSRPRKARTLTVRQRMKLLNLRALECRYGYPIAPILSHIATTYASRPRRRLKDDVFGIGVPFGDLTDVPAMVRLLDETGFRPMDMEARRRHFATLVLDEEVAAAYARSVDGGSSRVPTVGKIASKLEKRMVVPDVR